MTRHDVRPRIARCYWSLALLLAPWLAAAAQAQEPKRPEFVALHVGFADRYKAGLWTPIEVTLRGGSRPETGYVRASLADSDGLNCSFEAPEPCQLLPGEETKVPLYVRFGHENNAISLQLFDGQSLRAEKRFNSDESPKNDQFPDAIPAGHRLIVLVGRSSSGLEHDLPGVQGDPPPNFVVVVDGLARLPTRWEGYEGVDKVLISTGNPQVLFADVLPQNARIEALEQWVRMGGTLVLCAGSQAEAALHAGSPLARFVPGRFVKTELRKTSGAWETYAESQSKPIPASKPGETVELPTPMLSGVQGKIEASQGDDLPLVIRRPLGLGQVVFVAADLDRGPIREWSDRRRLVGKLLDLPADQPAAAAEDSTQQFAGQEAIDLAGQLRSALDVPRDVHLVPFSVVALLVIVYILLIGPGDYFLLRKLGYGMQWTWITFPIIVVLFAAGSYFSAYWLKGDQLRVSQIDLVDVDADGTVRGASWFSVFSPRGESFDLSMRPRLPDGQAPQQASVALAWMGKAGNEFNGMYHRNAPEAPLWSQGYSIAWSDDATSLDAIRGVPIQVWASKSFAQRWLGRAPDLGLDVALTGDDKRRQLSGTITNRLKGSDPQTKDGIALHHAFLAYGDWAYEIGELKPGQSVKIGPAMHRVTLSSYIGGQGPELSEEDPLDDDMPRSKTAWSTAATNGYNPSSRDMAYVLQRMLFYEAAGGRKQGNMANDYQGFTDLSGLLKAGRAILVAMPPQDGSCRGGELLRGEAPRPGEADRRRPLGNALDRHTTIYRFVLPVTPESDN